MNIQSEFNSHRTKMAKKLLDKILNILKLPREVPHPEEILEKSFLYQTTEMLRLPLFGLAAAVVMDLLEILEVEFLFDFAKYQVQPYHHSNPLHLHFSRQL